MGTESEHIINIVIKLRIEITPVVSPETLTPGQRLFQEEQQRAMASQAQRPELPKAPAPQDGAENQEDPPEAAAKLPERIFKIQGMTEGEFNKIRNHFHASNNYRKKKGKPRLTWLEFLETKNQGKWSVPK